MKNDIFVTRLARGAIATAITGASLSAQGRSSDFVSPQISNVFSTVTERSQPPEVTSGEKTPETLVLSSSPSVGEWTKSLEREFRRLAMEEATGTISPGSAQRLNHLSSLRDCLVHPRTSEEILTQLRRDRLLEKITDALKDYVEFQEGSGK